MPDGPNPWDLLFQDVEYIRSKLDILDKKLDDRLTPLESFASRIKGVLAVLVVLAPFLGALLLAYLKGGI